MNKIKNHIFTSCKSIFTFLDLGLFKKSNDLELVCMSDNENRLILKQIDCNEFLDVCQVYLFIEYYLGNKKYINPCFKLKLDSKNQRAEVLSFESDLHPKMKLNVYTEVDGNIYKNIVAEQDLEVLCFNWLKELKELNYRPLCVKTTA